MIVLVRKVTKLVQAHIFSFDPSFSHQINFAKVSIVICFRNLKSFKAIYFISQKVKSGEFLQKKQVSVCFSVYLRSLTLF